jgi:hypothetical protein
VAKVSGGDSNPFRMGNIRKLAILFIILKLGNVIGSSWFWVLSPLWIDGLTEVFAIMAAWTIFEIRKAYR